ncbi:PREDICTED: zinc finger FYVE domain-containing protein 1-like [Dufourea novaeangliae]|uniref:Zinc finger FYVE domain-containing protein 1 n=1 Tax=Dufourea novaeangliae TaxID=178035 RepID=A0A154PT38_DUFNO|nr:PREDICTED: zinc finger FYVE domain-containing protein 1-like [Dufourea novaeangliae]KZC14494.1 Zinc finger FYVE domain-containing protein 1 [Dufourea novaeangliae]
MSALWREHKMEATRPAIMESLDSMCICNRGVHHSNHDSVSINGICENGLRAKCQCNESRSFLLIDGQENLRVFSAEQFIEKLNCGQKDLKVKVVSIFGNTGDGKSHTLNQTFFKGEEVFKTSNKQNSCTLGVWAAFDPTLKVICLDTEGLLGVSTHENEQMRLLLKVLAVSDIVVYRTQSERLNKDLFMFLGTASRAYNHHFQTALQAVGQREGVLSSLSTLGPSVIVLHETRYTEPLTNNGAESAEEILRTRFAQMKLETEAFSSMKYVSLQTANPTADYALLQATIKKELNNTTVRSARQPYLVYNTLKVLNDKFSGEIETYSNSLFPDQYFTCPVKCLSCGCRCSNSMGHLREGIPHSSNTRCRYQHQYENLVYICKKCHSNGNEIQVTKRIQSQNDNSWYGLVKYAWAGDVIECPHCGEIYRSRQYWYGNKNPEDFAVRTEITHVWNMANPSITSQNTAQKVIDGVSYITEAVSNVSLQPTKVLSAWVADQVAPSYWRPNNEIKHCHKCKDVFGPTDTKHHCRACGEGFCSQCSSKIKCVPFRNWHTPVRVCDNCYSKDTNSNDETTETSEDVSARKVSEQVVSTLSAVGTVLNYSKSFIKDTVRPSYWIPDSEVVNCCICCQKFSISLPLHHCRDCGRGVCQDCSQHRKPVPHRGWDKPVRVCNSCIKID